MQYYKKLTINKKLKKLHRYVMECHLGRELSSDEVVHHINGDKHNNHIVNLKLMGHGEHISHHMMEKKVSGTFLRKYNFNKEEVRELLKTMYASEIAEKYGCGTSTIGLFIRNHKLRNNLKCKVCGEKIRYSKLGLCSTHYKIQWRSDQKIKKKMGGNNGKHT